MEERAAIRTSWMGEVALRGSDRIKAERSKGNGKVTLHKVPELLANSQTYSPTVSDAGSFSLTRRNRKSAR